MSARNQKLPRRDLLDVIARRMAALAEDAITRATNFGHYEIKWLGRAHNVEIFGH